MLSRLLDPRDGKPRDPVFWLVAAAAASTLLLAFWLVCTHQVRKAEVRRAQAEVQRMAGSDCPQALSGSTMVGCSATFATAAPMPPQEPVGATPASLR